MQEMALEINEDKRHKEEIMRLQDRFDGWTGRDITDYSSRLIYQGQLMKVGVSGLPIGSVCVCL